MEPVLEYTVYLDMKPELKPVLLLHLRPESHIDSLLNRQNADDQIRTRLIEVAATCPLETVHGISALGKKSKNPEIDPPTARYNTRGIDTVPATRWNLDILESTAEMRIQEIAKAIADACMALTKNPFAKVRIETAGFAAAHLSINNIHEQTFYELILHSEPQPVVVLHLRLMEHQSMFGTPKEDVFAKISLDTKAYIRSLPIRKPQAFRRVFSGADVQAIDLLSKMITWDPDKRLTVTEALSHPWLANYHDPADEPASPANFGLRYGKRFKTFVRKFEKQEEVPELSNSTLTIPIESPVASTVADAISSRVLTQTITEEPATEVKQLDEPIDGLPLPMLRDQSTLVGSGDPIATYRRRSSVLQLTGSPSMQARSSLYSHRRHPSFPSSEQEGEISYVIPARSRAASMLSGQSQLLRTLSTFSIHEKMDETGKLLPPEPTGADAPPSSIPREFVSIEGENIIQE
ncbi:hypothetical protein Clacol_005304 [Clathrus columnatus]|uniref:Protein kinase domain-containing protein n=1 Tax=Clathrus columnatus TaxID=1419009 RepID=A0AAV5AC65_9AGAM|nr:hypothetical protein Clacol_005304 [Clathrus columnatus]